MAKLPDYSKLSQEEILLRITRLTLVIAHIYAWSEDGTPELRDKWRKDYKQAQADRDIGTVVFHSTYKYTWTYGEKATKARKPARKKKE